MKTLLICHNNEPLNRDILPKWLASFSDLVGVIVLNEPKSSLEKRVKREIKRVGLIRFIDVIAFRFYYKLQWATKDKQWIKDTVVNFSNKFPEISSDVPILYAQNPNTSEVKKFIEQMNPDVMLARCKHILKENIFTIPKTGTFVLHPGICPEYRNAHGCFWALVNDDPTKVGATLLKIDKGVDTGPVYDYYYYDFDPYNESHIRIQESCVLTNLKNIENKLVEIHKGNATPTETKFRESQAWGQPWLTCHLEWKYQLLKNKRPVI